MQNVSIKIKEWKEEKVIGNTNDLIAHLIEKLPETEELKEIKEYIQILKKESNVDRWEITSDYDGFRMYQKGLRKLPEICAIKRKEIIREPTDDEFKAIMNKITNDRLGKLNYPPDMEILKDKEIIFEYKQFF